MRYDIQEIKDRLSIPQAWRALSLPGEPATSCSSPFRPDKEASFSIYGRKWKDHATGDGGDVIDFVAKALGLEKKEAIAHAAMLAGVAGTSSSGSMGKRAHTPPPRPSGPTIGQIIRAMEEAAGKARKRAQWPTFTRPTDGDVLAIAGLRNLPVEAVDVARSLGIIWSTVVDGAACFVIREGDHFAQAIRYDGLPFILKDGKSVKKKNLPGSISTGFVGWSALGDPACPVLVVEGAVGWLEGIAAILATDADVRPGAGWTVLAAISCNSRLAGETATIPDLSGRRFRILPDHDVGEKGFNAAAGWQAELESRGATAGGYRLPSDRPGGCKDLGPIVAHAKANHEYLNKLFTI